MKHTFGFTRDGSRECLSSLNTFALVGLPEGDADDQEQGSSRAVLASWVVVRVERLIRASRTWTFSTCLFLFLFSADVHSEKIQAIKMALLVGMSRIRRRYMSCYWYGEELDVID